MGMETEAAQFHVLAVDDSFVDRKLIEKLLKTSFYQVTTVDSGSKALEFLGLLNEDDQRNQKTDLIEVNLIITDYSMPGMTGYDLLRRIKESDAFKDIPVVIMSSENIPSRINRCLEKGAEEFLLKPVQLSDVKKLKPHPLKGRSKEMDCESNNIRGMELEDHQEINSAAERTRTENNNNLDVKENDVLQIFMESLKNKSTCCSNQMVFSEKEKENVFGTRDLIPSSLTLEATSSVQTQFIIFLLSSTKNQTEQLMKE